MTLRLPSLGNSHTRLEASVSFRTHARRTLPRIGALFPQATNPGRESRGLFFNWVLRIADEPKFEMQNFGLTFV